LELGAYETSNLRYGRNQVEPDLYALADDYNDVAAQGYRWAIVDGPFACTAQQEIQQV
jgi:hypothetical protein